MLRPPPYPASPCTWEVDSLWLDATEPEGLPNANQKVHLGAGNAYMNPYSLMTTKAPYLGDALPHNVQSTSA